MTKSTGNGSEPWPRVIVAMPRERTMTDCGHVSMLRIAQQGYPIIDLPYSRTDVARNKFAQHLLDSTFTHVLMLDADHDHPADIVEKLARWVVNDHDILVVGALIHRRGAPFDALMFLPDGNGGMYSPVTYPDGLVKLTNEHGPGMITTSALLISREVFERLEWPWFAYEYKRKGEYPTEDIYFSQKCNEAGIDLWVDTTVECPHMIETFVTKKTHHDYIAAHPEAVEQIDRVEA